MSEQKIKKPAAVISVAIQKGGSAKTTLAVNLAAELGSQGYNVLVIDVDPQANASAHISVAHPSTLSKNEARCFGVI
jgi:chromosome partitioning protein